MDSVCIEITKIVKRELSSIDTFVDAKCSSDGSTNSGFGINNNRLKKCKQKERNQERKKNRRPEGEGKEGRKGGVATHRMSAEFFNEEPLTRALASENASERTSMSNPVARNNDKEVKPEGAKGFQTNLRVKVKASKKNKGSKASKESTEEGNPRYWFAGKTNVDVPSSTVSFLDLPANERSRRRLSDSLELENRSPPRARRRSVSFDPLTVFKTAILQNDADTVRAILDSGKVNANTILDGTLPVVMAAKDGSADCLELLIKKGARIDARSKQGLSPLELAVRGGHFDCAQCLISSGANAKCIRDGYFDESIESANRATTRSRSKTF